MNGNSWNLWTSFYKCVIVWWYIIMNLFAQAACLSKPNSKQILRVLNQKQNAKETFHMTKHVKRADV